MVEKKKGLVRPKWLKEFRKRTALIDVIDLAYAENCDCKVCKKIREVAIDLEELFMPKPGTRK